MIFADKRIKDRGKVLVRVPVSCIDTTVLVVELNSTGNGLSKGESRGLGGDALQLVPLFLSDMFGHQRVL